MTIALIHTVQGGILVSMKANIPFSNWFNCTGKWGRTKRPNWLILLVLSIVQFVHVAIAESHGTSYGYLHTPGDTRIVTDVTESFGSFCSGIRLTDVSTYISTLICLSRRPQLASYDDFLLESKDKVVDEVDDYMYWRYYLHKGSNFTATVCMKSLHVSVLSLLIIRGAANFDSWMGSRKVHFTASTLMLSTQCPYHDNISYTVTADYAEDWYIVVYNSGNTSEMFDLTLKVTRTEYAVTDKDVIHSCSTASTENWPSCTIPITTGATYMVRIEPGSFPNYKDTTEVRIQCVKNSTLRIAATSASVVFVLALSVIIIVLYGSYRWMKVAKEQNPERDYIISRQPETSHDEGNVSSLPQQYNPESMSVPPPYAPPRFEPPSYESALKACVE